MKLTERIAKALLEINQHSSEPIVIDNWSVYRIVHHNLIYLTRQGEIQKKIVNEFLQTIYI